VQQISPAMERAVKYVWNDKTADWETKRVKIVMEEEPFKEGGMRIAHKAWEVTGDQMIAGVAKYFKQREVSSNMCFNEAMTQMLADDYALRFNEALGSHREIRFVPVTVLRLSERSGQIVSFEPFLGGKYVKHNDNDGHVDTTDEMPQAFSHFTWEASNQKILVCDIQGVDDLYTDPQIHSIDGEGFGSGNMGFSGIRKFFESHKCNGVCRSMELRKVDPNAIRAPSAAPSEVSEADTVRAKSHGIDRSNSGGSSADDSGHGPAYLSSAEVSRALDRGRSARRVSLDAGMCSDEDQDSTLSQAQSARSRGKSRFRVGSIWSTGKAFGKALISAVKASVHSPPSSRSISPVSTRAPGSPLAAGRQPGSPIASAEPLLTAPQKFQSRRRRVGSLEGTNLVSGNFSPLPPVAERSCT